VDAVTREVHPIETESYRIMRSRVDTSVFPPLHRQVVERIVHTTADVSWVGDVVADEDGLVLGRNALLAGAPLIVDVRMLAAGITARESVIAIDAPGTREMAAKHGITRSAAGVRLAAAEHPEGAVWAIGNAPTALSELLDLIEAGSVTPALVVGLPVGFVGAAESKALLRRTTARSVSNLTERGGAAVAAAAVNALLYAE
jgi:precorrin-8X/cobalt-precorrin-8 methylmutase